MTVKTALASIRKKGLRKYLGDYRRNAKEKRRLEKARPEIEAKLKGFIDLAISASNLKEEKSNSEIFDMIKPMAEYISLNYKDIKKVSSDKMEILFEKMKSLEEDREYNNFIKAHYIKDTYPKIYSELSDRPVTNKVIVMESGHAPSPSSKLLAKEIKKQGVYEVVYMGLLIRTVPNVVFYENGVRMIKELATAKAMFLSTANELLSHFDIRKETKIIQLWHGVGAFKHVGHSTVNNKHFGKNRKQWEEYDSYRNYYAVTTAAEGQQWIFEESMHLKPEQIKAIGISRTDVFFDDEYKENALKNLHDRFPQIKGKKIILYAPTFRGVVGKAKAPDRLDVRALAENLSSEYVLLIKHHGLSKDVPPIPEELKDNFAFDLNTDNVLNIDELLAVSDILITDYSSVAFEFAITERPILFFVYDLEDYIEQRGLYFDFEKEAPGPLCRTTEDIVRYISDIDNMFDIEKLLAFKQTYVEACDGHSTERTIALIEE